ncbi:hypothetical protein KJ359_012390 [Pestalotiopsis sp. 9143b]|nr:hypothetical protein KJ359_012390 [Pestalotiopsis sp. 9143b]
MELDSEVPRYGVRELHEASAQGDEAEITRLLSQDIHLLEAKLGGLTPLMQALREKQSESIKILLDWGANANARSLSGLACMWFAMKSDRLHHVALLLKAGADPNESNQTIQLTTNGLLAEKKQEALYCALFAVQQPTLDALHLLVAYGWEIDLSAFINRVCVKNAMRLNRSMHLLALLAFGKHRELAERTIDLEVTEEIKSIFDKWSSRTEDIECRTVLRKHIGSDGALNYHSLLVWAVENKKFETLEYVLDLKGDSEFLKMRFEGLSAIQYARRRAKNLLASSKAKHKPRVSYIVLDDESDDASPPSTNKKVKREDSGAVQASDSALPGNHSKFAEPRAFDNIKEMYQRNFELHEKDGVIKIAILDTGFGPMSDDQNCMIKSRRNFCDHARAEDDVADLDGHGTAVAGIILRLAPRSEVYIARICTGVPGSGKPQHPQPTTVAQAIAWAVEQGVDLINMSFGFDESNLNVRRALKKASNHCIVFAAASNDGNFKRMAWPARDPDLGMGSTPATAKAQRPPTLLRRPMIMTQ